MSSSEIAEDWETRDKPAKASAKQFLFTMLLFQSDPTARKAIAVGMVVPLGNQRGMEGLKTKNLHPRQNGE
jgi:hypothetical protein